MDELMEKLDETEMSSPAWLTYMKQLAEKVEHHLDEEEHEVFQMAGKALTEKEKKSLATDYQKAIKENR
jgi:hemerythrin-like domain-containing protein